MNNEIVPTLDHVIGQTGAVAVLRTAIPSRGIVLVEMVRSSEPCHSRTADGLRQGW